MSLGHEGMNKVIKQAWCKKIETHIIFHALWVMHIHSYETWILPAKEGEERHRERNSIK